MNKYQEALFRIRLVLRTNHDEKWLYNELNLLHKIVEKETPKKPVYREFMRNTPQQEFRESCPNCNNVFDYDGLGKKHCCHCGQAIDWGKHE